MPNSLKKFSDNPNVMTSYKILLVEDEVLIADNIKRFLNKQGHQVVGIAINYKEAIQAYLAAAPDIVLLDIRLSGAKSGIDVARFIQKQENPRPFIFLTSQMDRKNIQAARETFPSAYLSKPVHKESLFATIEIAMHTFNMKTKVLDKVSLYDGEKHYLIPIDHILFLQSDHVYVQVYIEGEKTITQRGTLRNLLDQLPPKQFFQTHRSFAVNLEKVDQWSLENIFINNFTIPISRSKRKEINELLTPANRIK